MKWYERMLNFTERYKVRQVEGTEIRQKGRSRTKSEWDGWGPSAQKLSKSLSVNRSDAVKRIAFRSTERPAFSVRCGMVNLALHEGGMASRCRSCIEQFCNITFGYEGFLEPIKTLV